ncbi:MAG TPA: hypothetical protein PLI18_06345 [Pirellulaceae bacterium]|nr:hypothetical protein [Pirellulaceae bacterium]
MSDSNGTNLGWSLYGDRATGYSVVHVASGETATVPYVGSKSAPDRTELSLVERNGGTFVADRFDALRIEDGLVKAVDLAPGDYELRLKHERRSVLIRVTAGERVGGLALGSARKLELRDADPVRIVEAVAADRKLRIRTAGGNAMTRVHVLATRYRPAFDSFASFDRVRDGENYWMTRPGAPSGYQSGRSIGEEYQYILDRKYARKFPGVMLERPSLLLDPWAVRTTSTGEQTAATGDEFGATDAPAPATAAVADPGALAAAGFDDPINLDFLASGTLLAANRTPQEGVIEIEFPEGFDKHWLTIVAIDGRSTASRSLVVDEPKVVPLDLRLPESLDPTGAFVQRKQVEGLVAGQTLEMAVGSSRFQSYDSVRAVYTLMATLSNDPRFAQFAFLPDWPTFDLEKKRAKYSEFACHELNLFLYYRDREFFDAVIRPYVANKLHKTFVDRWLIGDDLSEFRTPWNYSQLNAFERILLARRIADEAAETRRRLEQQYEIGPITRDEFDRLFQIGVKGFALDAGLANEDFALFYDSIAQNGQAVPDGDAVLLGGIARGFGGGGGGMGGMGGGMPGGGPANEPAPPPGMPGAAGRRMRGAEAARAESLADRESGAAEGESRFARRQVELEALSLERKLAERLFRQVDKTQEWAENRWYQLPLDQQTADRIGTNRFWIDFVKHEGETGFLSPHLAEATDNLSEMLLALAVLDLPFEAPEHKSEIEGDRITLTAAGPMIVFHEQIRPALEAKENEPPILVSQNFFRADDRYRYEGNEQLDKFVVDEFLTHVVYGGQIAVTNPTSSRRRLDLLVEIPQGALPVLGGKATRSIPVDLEPFATRTVETYFYFPAAGDYDHYPVQVSAEERRIAAADPFRFHVVREATVIDRTSWEWVSQYASDDEVLAYLEEHNPLRLDLSRIAFRMSDKGFYERAIAQLSRRHLFEPTLWSYAIRHDDPATIREYLNFRDDFLATVGPWFDGELLSIDPEHRRRYEHLDYRPLVNARTHRLGPQRRILNDRLNEQYHRLMEILSLQPRPNDEDRLAVTYYLLLQDRFEEAIATFESVDRAKVGTPLQYDLFDAWLDLIRENPTRAREIAGKYLEYPVDRWRNAFAAIAAQCDEIAGAGVAVVDDDDRTQQQTAAADRTPSFDFNVADRKIDLSWRNLESVTIRFYRMDVELLFSRNPFVQAEAGRFSHIRPNETLEVTLPAGETNRTIELPESLRTANVLVEVTGGSESRAQAYYAHALDVQLQDEFGQLQVRLATDRKPLSRTYVKVYARMNDGSIRFYKDGYTDLRGRFDYASLSTDALDSVERFSILVLHDEHGALVRETAPPKR